MCQTNPAPTPSWYDRYANLFSLGGTVLTLIGIGIAIFQIWDTKDALIASNQYQITKDDAELISAIPDDAYNAIFNGEAGALGQNPAAERHVVRLLSFASSIVEQRDLGLMTDDFWEVYHRNFCGFLRLPAMSDYWKAKIAQGYLDFPKEFVATGSACLK